MPQNYNAARRLNRKERRSLDVRIGFFEGLVRRDPDDVEFLELLGDAYSQRGDTQLGLSVDEQLCRLQPHNPRSYYNLACSYSLSGQINLAVLALERAIALGYRDFKWLAADPDMEPMRRHPLFRELEAKIRRITLQVT
jgi:tetratricopeptide (TPR) repeat protein